MVQMTQQWAELEEFPDYAVSDLGEIGNMKTGLIRKVSINQQGNVKVSIYRGKELYTRSVAVMVAEAFVEGRSEFFNTPIHLDGDKTNCRADNLMWRPRWFAVNYHRQFYEEAFFEHILWIQELTTGREYPSVHEACIDLGLYYNDVYRSYIHETQIPLTRHEFRVL